MVERALRSRKVFVSSTLEDLAEHRKAVFEAINEVGAETFGIESQRAEPVSMSELARSLVAEADAFVGIYARRYGSTPPDSHVSYLESEYRLARELGKPIFAFDIGPDVPWSAQFVDTGLAAEALERFKKEVYSHHVVESFTTPTDLAAKVASALVRYFQGEATPEEKGRALEYQKDHTVSGDPARLTPPRVWWFYADGEAEEQIGLLHDRDQISDWGANPGTHPGDIVLMYRTDPYSDLAYVFQAGSSARERRPGLPPPPGEDPQWKFVADLTSKWSLARPIPLRDLAEHPRLKDWNFAKRPQGALRWTADLREQGHWETVRGLLLATNPQIAEPMTSWDQRSLTDLIEAALPVAEEIPDEERRQEALSNLQSLGTPDVEAEADTAGYQPQPRVARDYWTTDDTLGLAPYADAIAAFVRHKETRPPLTIGIKAPWGAGKTSLMRIVQAQVDPPVDAGLAKWKFPELRLTREAKDRLGSSPEAASREGGVTVGTVFARLRTAPSEPPSLSGIEATDVKGKTGTDWRPTVWFNPWMYQTGEEVWAGLAHEIIEQICGRLVRRDRERFWLELNLRRADRDAIRRKIFRLSFVKILPTAVILVVGMLLTLGAALGDVPVELPVAGGTGAVWLLGLAAQVWRLFKEDASVALSSLVRPPQIGPVREAITGELEGTFDEIFPDLDYRSKTGFLHLVQTDIRHVLDLVATPDRPLVIFVDDLDRCSPGVVAQTIEAINLFLAGEFPNCVFVLAVEPAVVAAHVEVAHEKLVERLRQDALRPQLATLGWRFLEKIVQLPLSLPRPNPTQTRDYLKSLFTKEEVGGEEQPAPDTSAADAVRGEVLLKVQGQKPTLDALPSLINEAVAGLPDDQAASVRRDVVADVFDRFFRDSDPLVQQIVENEALLLPSRNAREIKRLLNLFRFYSFIAARRRLLDVHSSETQRETLEKVAKLGVLSIRWPFLLDALARPAALPSMPSEPADPDGMPIQLEVLEAAASNDQQWRDAVLAAGLVHPDPETGRVSEPEWIPRFQAFLNRKPSLGTFVRGFF